MRKKSHQINKWRLTKVSPIANFLGTSSVRAGALFQLLLQNRKSSSLSTEDETKRGTLICPEIDVIENMEKETGDASGIGM